MSRTRDIRLSVPLRASPERAWKALTSARELCLWWLELAETEPRNLGRLRLVWPEGRDFPVRSAQGVYVDLEPGRKLAWLWRPAPRGVPPLVSVFLEPKARGCAATVHHAGFGAGDGALRERWLAGWEDFLGRLRKHLGARAGGAGRGGKRRAPAVRRAS